MPSNWLYIDTNFPSFTQKESANDKIETMQDYLFMLVEQLRYTLHNLDGSNMNQNSLSEFIKNIREPIYAKIEDTDKNVNELSITAQGLSARISNAEGDITQLGATAQGLAARISNAEGNITQLGATAQGLAARISSAEGDITQLGATAQGLAARISNAEGDITSLTATANGLSASVSSLNGSVTNLTADVNGLRTTVSGKINSAQAQTLIDQSLESITLAASSDDSGTVFQIKKDGAVLASTGTFDICVDAVNIYGTLTAQEIEGDTITVRNDQGRRCGYIYTEYASTADYKMTLESKAMELNATTGALYLSGWGAAIELDVYISCNSDVAPNSNNRYDLGTPALAWRDIYCGTGELNGSDRNIKNSIEPLPEKYVKMLDMVEPKRYKLNSGTSGRYHVGFIAQEVEDAMNACGIDSQEFGGWAKAKDADGNDTYFLRYGEFIAILLAKLREQDRRIERLEGTT